jgi:hypothetical protein
MKNGESYCCILMDWLWPGQYLFIYLPKKIKYHANIYPCNTRWPFCFLSQCERNEGFFFSPDKYTASFF